MGLAGFFDKLREIIEAAETPFSKLAIFILPILSPLVPASFTGLHIYKLLLELFSFQYADQFSTFLAVIVAMVLELLGYIGAILFIHSIYHWIRTKDDAYMLPSGLNGLAYVFYLVAMFLINFQLGKYFQTPTIINNIVGLLSFITVPTSLLAANHLSEKEVQEESFQLRQERRQDSLERYRIKHGNFPESSEKVSKTSGKFPGLSKKLSNLSRKLSNWRKDSRNLSEQELVDLANLTPAEMQQWASSTGLSYKTISNYRKGAREMLGE